MQILSRISTTAPPRYYHKYLTEPISTLQITRGYLALLISGFHSYLYSSTDAGCGAYVEQ